MLKASLALFLVAGGVRAAVDRTAAVDELLARHPSARVQEGITGKVANVSGPLTQGLTPAQAATDFVNRHGAVFGLDKAHSRLHQLRAHDIAMGKNSVFEYAQHIDGLEVEGGRVIVVTLNRAAPVEMNLPALHEVVFASALLAEAPAGGFAPDALTAQQARAKVASLPRFGGLTMREAELVVWAGLHDLEAREVARRAWKFSGDAPADQPGSTPRSYLFFVDAATGEILEVRNQVHHADISGTVQGLVTMNNRPAVPSNPPVMLPMRGMKVSVVGNPAATTFTNPDGTFTIPWPGTAPVQIQFGVANGRWSNVLSDAGSVISNLQTVMPGTPVTLDVNPSPTPTTQSQVNGHWHTHDAHDFVRSRAPGWNALDLSLTTRVNVSGSCNAFFTANPLEIQFFAASSECPNMAYSSVIAHEYGHFVVNRRGLAQQAFGEGYSDSLAIMINDSPAVAIGFFNNNPNGSLRNPIAVPVNYPCSSGAHTCGQVLAGVVWLTTEGIKARLGNTPGLDAARQLFVDWTLITLGSNGTGQSAHPQSPPEWIAVDDDDSDPANGSPNYNAIAAAFTARNIVVPCIESRATVRFNATIPDLAPSNTPLTVPVDVIAGPGATLVAGSPRLVYRTLPAGAWTTVPLALVSGNAYTMTIPASACGTTLEFHVDVDVNIAGSVQTVQYPLTASCGPTTDTIAFADSTSETLVTFEPIPSDPLYSYQDWIIASAPLPGIPLIAQPAGRWTRSAPIGQNAFSSEPQSDTTPDPGINCFQTGRSTTQTQQDVNGGATVVTSPAFDLANADDASIAFSRWWHSNGTSTPTSDYWRVDVSVDNGVTWVAGETLAQGVQGTAWGTGSFSLGALGLRPSAQTRFRFIAADLGLGNIVEAAIDDVRIQTRSCNAGPVCDSLDFNNDGVFPSSDDIVDFLSVYAGGACPTPSCNDIDFNNDGVFPSGDDIDALLRVFGGGNC